jgi:hypothetical protein
MSLRRRPSRTIMAGTAVAVALSGCGSSGPSDKDQIAMIVKREGARPTTLCDHLTGSLLGQVGGRRGCLLQATSAAPDRTTHARTVRVLGKTATAVVVDKTGSRAISLVKQKGVWKISAVLGGATN